MKIAIIDSGIHATHPHVERVAGGINLTGAGSPDDFIDRLGHGTAVAAAIREKAPAAELYAVKVFDARLSAHLRAIIAALEWCAEKNMDLINLSLGTANSGHRFEFERAIRLCAPVISAADLLPGSLPEVIGAAADPACPRDRFFYRDGVFHASPCPRPIPGVPAERNLNGVSFAVANVTGFLASFAGPHAPRTVEQARELLVASASVA